MRDVIQRLRRMQEIDNRVNEAARTRDSLRDKLEKLHMFLESFAGALEDKRTRLAEAERFYRERVAELAQDQETIKRLQARMGSVTKTKEFNAATREIDTLKKAVKQKEAEIAKLNEEIQKFRETIDGEHAELESKRAEVAEEKAMSDSELTRLTSEIDAVADERAEVERDLQTSLVRKYRRIADRRDGLAIVEVCEGQCTGCNRQIPPQLRIILLRGETIETCPFCSRFIYVPDDEVGRYSEHKEGEQEVN